MDPKKFTWKHTAIVFIILIIILTIVAGVSSSTSNRDEQAIDTVTFGGYPEDSYWEMAPLLLYDRPGGLAAGAKEISRVSDPLGETVDIYSIQEVDGGIFYKIGIKGKKGWTTKYIVTGEE